MDLGTALLNTTLLHEYLGAAHVDGAYWSLVIEVTFYSWMALLFFALGSWQRLRIAPGPLLVASYIGVLWCARFLSCWNFRSRTCCSSNTRPVYRRHADLPRYGMEPQLQIAFCLLSA